MTDAQKAAKVFAQAVAALAEIEAMRVANHEREANGEAYAYDEAAFREVPERYGIDHNAIMATFYW